MNKPTILIVEDDDILLEAITKKLHLNNINTLGSVRGNQGLSYLNDMETLPDAIWLDYELTDMDGEKFVTELRKNPKLLNIPIFVISNSASQAKIDIMMNFGIKKYLLKSKYRLDEIIKIIVDNIHLEQKDVPV